MPLWEFIEKFVCDNSLIRLWVIDRENRGGHKMLYITDYDKPGNIDEVCMEHEILNDKDWRSEFKNRKVIGVNDIYVPESYYKEAINIVIE